MSLSVTVDVFCDGCTAWVEGVQGRTRMAGAEARQLAVREADWRCDHRGDFCPSCVKAGKP